MKVVIKLSSNFVQFYQNITSNSFSFLTGTQTDSLKIELSRRTKKIRIYEKKKYCARYTLSKM